MILKGAMVTRSLTPTFFLSLNILMNWSKLFRELFRKKYADVYQDKNPPPTEDLNDWRGKKFRAAADTTVRLKKKILY